MDYDLVWRCIFTGLLSVILDGISLCAWVEEIIRICLRRTYTSDYLGNRVPCKIEWNVWKIP
jgi:hypothetical protein